MKSPLSLSWLSLVCFALLPGIPSVESSTLWARSTSVDAWDTKARPLFEQYCVGCHGPESSKGWVEGWISRKLRFGAAVAVG